MSQAYKEVTTGQIVTPEDARVPWFEAQARWQPTDEKPKATRKRRTSKAADEATDDSGDE